MPEVDNLEPSPLNTNNGPGARQLLMQKIEKEFDEGNIRRSIFYQVSSLYGIMQDHYFSKNVDQKKVPYSHLPQKENKEDDAIFDNALLRYVKNYVENNLNQKEHFIEELATSCNFLANINHPDVGFQKILDVCKEFPEEWTIVQICKGPRPQTTYSLFRELHEREADIYLTILKHARSSEYPDPICIRLSDFSQIKMFQVFSKILDQCKAYMGANPKEISTYDAKLKYFDNLKQLDTNIRQAIDELRAYIFPWSFIFRGVLTLKAPTGSEMYQKEAFADVDILCNNFNFKERERVLLSLAALQVPYLNVLEIEAIPEYLTDQKKAQSAIHQLLLKLQTNLATLTKSPHRKSNNDSNSSYSHTHFPCILIVDEQLDHFYWEELNITQEICRVNSLQCLHMLYDTYKDRIKSGYLQVNLKKGACVINPDQNLPKTEMRMGAFFNYWLPSWTLKLGTKATQEELFDDFFKRDCYFYAGHGSGLQHINGKRISNQKIEAVVFLFGCDSTRMTSSGLFSDMIATHFYYHAAMCPTIIGTTLPALDCKMDEISVEILNRCIAPEINQTATWDQIDSKLWAKQGIIQRIAATDYYDKNKKNPYYQIASICGALTIVRARGEDKCFYNTVPYVCRGLPAWNCDIQPLPK